MSITVSSAHLVLSKHTMGLNIYPHHVGARLQKAEELSVVRMGFSFPLKNLTQVS